MGTETFARAFALFSLSLLFFLSLAWRDFRSVAWLLNTKRSWRGALWGFQLGLIPPTLCHRGLCRQLAGGITLNALLTCANRIRGEKQNNYRGGVDGFLSICQGGVFYVYVLIDMVNLQKLGGFSFFWWDPIDRPD